MTENPPQFQRAEPPTERNVPVPVVDNGTRVARLVP